MTPTSTPPAGLHDILYHVLSHLTPSPEWEIKILPTEEASKSRSARKALACLARSHSTFTQPALAALWRSLASQEPLEHVLCVVGIAQRPPKQGRSKPTPKVEMCGGVRVATHGPGWRRFQQYASLVQKIIVDPFDRSSKPAARDAQLWEDNFWCQLCSAFGDTAPILPHLEVAILRNMRTHRPFKFDIGCLRLINALSLRTLDITVTNRASKEDIELLKGVLVARLPMQRLETLSFEASNPAPFLDTELLLRLHHLRFLTLECIERATPIEFSHLRHLTALSNLERLAVCLHSRDFLHITTPITFSALRSFEMTCYEHDVIDNVLAHVEFPRLQTFSIIETHNESPDLSQKLLRNLRTLVAKCPSFTAFRWVSNQTMDERGLSYRRPRHVGTIPLAALMAPLLAHRALRHFSLSLWGPIVPYTPADLRVMAEAWPDLETFKLAHAVTDRYSQCQAERYSIEAESIVAFARCCPRLRSFHIPVVHFDPSAPVYGEWAHHPPAPHGLSELRVQRLFTIPCHSDEEFGEECRKEDVVQFRSLLTTMFRSAVSIRAGRMILGLGLRGMILDDA